MHTCLDDLRQMSNDDVVYYSIFLDLIIRD